MNRYKYIATMALWACFSIACFSQFEYKGSLPQIPESGYYHILLNPDVLSYSSSGLKDIRIKDEKGTEVPYLLRTEKPRKEEISFENFELTGNEFSRKDSLNRVIVDNRNKEEIRRLCILIQAADVSKHIAVKGSEDRKNWYAVKQKTPITGSTDQDEAIEILAVDLPKGNYRYYELLIGSNQSDPIQVLKVGKYKYSELLGNYTEVSLKHFVQVDSTDKKTYLRFPKLNRSYYADKLGLDIEFKTDYRRVAGLTRLSSGDNPHLSIIQEFTLSSKTGNDIQTSGLKVDKNIGLVIDNKDNPPLIIKGINILQLNRYLTVYLEKGIHYELFCGDAQVEAPQYDIVYFDQDIPQHLPMLKVENLQKLNTDQVVPEEGSQRSFFETTAFMWTVIIIVGLLLLLMCFQIIRKSKAANK